MKKPDYESKPYRGGRVSPDSQTSSQDYGIAVGDDKVYTIFPFRRRTIDAPELAWKEAQSLFNSIKADKLHEIGVNQRSDIRLNVHYVNFTKEDDLNGQDSRTFGAKIGSAGKIGECVFEEQELSKLVQEAFKKGQRVVISIKGSWIPPELEGRMAGKAKSPHFRRTARRLILVTGSGVSEECRAMTELFRNKQNGGSLLPEEEAALAAFLSENQLKTEWVRVIDNGGIHYADGTYNETDSSQPKNTYVIRAKNGRREDEQQAN